MITVTTNDFGGGYGVVTFYVIIYACFQTGLKASKKYKLHKLRNRIHFNDRKDMEEFDDLISL